MRHEGSFFCMEGGERIENVIGRIEEIHLQRFHRLECFAGFEGEFASKGIVQKKAQNVYDTFERIGGHIWAHVLVVLCLLGLETIV